ncbi:MAG: hypothetical protein D6760_05715 [Deltaproteobacteria bacterium]|nr:MAG: hypothetical protein D6760_05715 [Deltaproteobacteria bacterium]
MTPSRRTRTLYVTGKGGAGKSFITALLAREAARRGVRTAVVELVDEQPSPEDTEPPKSAWLRRIVLDQRAALAHLLTRLLRLPVVARRLLDSRTFSAVSAAAPGVKEIVYLSYLRDLACGRTPHCVDLVLVNGLASGHSRALLLAPERIGRLVPLGPVSSVVGETASFVTDEARFRVAVVTTPEELAVSETEELHDVLAQAGVPVTATVVNGVYPPRLTVEQLKWVRDHDASSDAMLYMNRRARQLALAERVASPAGQPLLLPYFFGSSPLEARTRGRLYEALVGGWS